MVCSPASAIRREHLPLPCGRTSSIFRFSGRIKETSGTYAAIGGDARKRLVSVTLAELMLAKGISSPAYDSKKRHCFPIYCLECASLDSTFVSLSLSPPSPPSSRGRRASSINERRRCRPCSRSLLSSRSDSQATPLRCQSSIRFANFLVIAPSAAFRSWP